MKNKYKFTLCFLLTLIISRIIIYFYDPNPLLFGIELHHFYYGIILLIISFTLIKTKAFIPTLAISIALIIDEFYFIFFTTRNHLAYLFTFWQSLIPAIIISAIVILFPKTKFINKKSQ